MRRARWILAVLATAAFAASAAQPSAGGAPRAAEPSVTVAGGATKIARWELFVRSPKPGRRCLGMRVWQLWDESVTARGERCGARKLGRNEVTLQTIAPAGLGSFVYGRAGRSVGQVEVRIAHGSPIRLGTLPTPIPPGGWDRFWIVHAGSACAAVSVQSLGWRSGVPGKRRSGRIGPPGCG